MSSTRVRLTNLLQKLQRFKKPLPTIAEQHKFNIVRGDKVEVIGRNHPELGKQGLVLHVLRSRDRVVVEGVNLKVRYIKGNADKGIPARQIYAERAIPYCHVNLVDPVSGLPTRVIRQYLQDGTKVRVAKRSGAIIPRPDILTMRKRPVRSITSPESDTMEDADVWENTYSTDDQQQQQQAPLSLAPPST